MEAYAVVKTGGKQYRVEEGTVVDVERLEAEEGSEIVLGSVLAVSDGVNLTLGTPELEGTSVSATVLEHTRAKKIVAFKKKRRQGYRRKIGHRQNLTKIKISNISAAKVEAKVEAEAEIEAQEE